MNKYARSIGNYLFGGLALKMCQILLWLAPDTIVAGNLMFVVAETTDVLTLNRPGRNQRCLMVRCHIKYKPED